MATKSAIQKAKEAAHRKFQPRYEGDLPDAIDGPVEDCTPDPTCTWTWCGVDDSWDTECGQKHQFFDGTPEDNRHTYCPYCGGELKIGDPPKWHNY